MSKAVSKFNGLTGAITIDQLEKIASKAKAEGQTILYNRITTAIAQSKHYQGDIVFNRPTPAMEQVPNEFIPGLSLAPDYLCDSDTPGLGKGVSPDDIYQMITNKMIKLIEAANEKDYVKTWSNQNQEGYLIPFNFDSKKAYRGINQIILTEGGSTILENPFFMTFKQVERRKGKITQGSHGHEVVYFTRLYSYQQQEPKIDFGTYDPKKFLKWANANRGKISDMNGVKGNLSAIELMKRSLVPILKYYNVFNGADIEGIDFDLKNFKIGYVKNDKALENNDSRVEIADLIIENFPKPQPPLSHKGNRAFYSPGADTVTMPQYKNFTTGLNYYRTLLHEFTHATGATKPKRLERDFSGKFGSKKYAKEELIAEFGAVFLSAHAGIMWRTNTNHAAYLKNWNSALTHLENDNRFFMRAASAAQKATDFILNLNEDGIPAYQKKLAASPVINKEPNKHLPKKLAIGLDALGRLKPGYLYLKGGEIKKVTRTKKKQKTTAKTSIKAQPPSTSEILKNGDPVRLVKNWGKPKKGDIGVIKQRSQRKDHDGEPIYNVRIAGESYLIPSHALEFVDILEFIFLEKTKNKPKAVVPPARNNAKETAKAGAAFKGKRTTKTEVVKKKAINPQYELGLKRPSDIELTGHSKPNTRAGQEFSGDHSPSLVSATKQLAVKTPAGSSRMIKAADVASMEFETLEFDEGWESVFQDPAKNMKLAIDGGPKNGKTAACMKFAAYLTKFGKVLYNVVDQGINKSTKDLLQLTGLIDKPNAYITISDTLDDLEADIKELQPDFIFIDMINQYIDKTKIKPHEFKDRFIKKYNDVGIILIFEVTKDGKFKGEQGWTHLVDGLGTVENYILETKGRYGTGEMITWPEGAEKFAPKRYAELMADQPIIEIDY